jgi:hypothetical protein
VFTASVLFVSGNFSALNVRELFPLQTLTRADERLLAAVLRDLGDGVGEELRRLRKQFGEEVVSREISEVRQQSGCMRVF